MWYAVQRWTGAAWASVGEVYAESHGAAYASALCRWAGPVRVRTLGSYVWYRGE